MSNIQPIPTAYHDPKTGADIGVDKVIKNFLRQYHLKDDTDVDYRKVLPTSQVEDFERFCRRYHIPSTLAVQGLTPNKVKVKYVKLFQVARSSQTKAESVSSYASSSLSSSASKPFSTSSSEPLSSSKSNSVSSSAPIHFGTPGQDLPKSSAETSAATFNTGDDFNLFDQPISSNPASRSEQGSESVESNTDSLSTASEKSSERPAEASEAGNSASEPVRIVNEGAENNYYAKKNNIKLDGYLARKTKPSYFLGGRVHWTHEINKKDGVIKTSQVALNQSLFKILQQFFGMVFSRGPAHKLAYKISKSDLLTSFVFYNLASQQQISLASFRNVCIAQALDKASSIVMRRVKNAANLNDVLNDKLIGHHTRWFLALSQKYPVLAEVDSYHSIRRDLNQVLDELFVNRSMLNGLLVGQGKIGNAAGDLLMDTDAAKTRDSLDSIHDDLSAPYKTMMRTRLNKKRNRKRK